MGKPGKNEEGQEQIRRTRSVEIKTGDIFRNDIMLDTGILQPAEEMNKSQEAVELKEIPDQKPAVKNEKIVELRNSARSMKHIVPERKASITKPAKKLSGKKAEKQRLQKIGQDTAAELERLHKDLETEEVKAFGQDKISEINRKRYANLSQSDIKKRVEAAMKKKENAKKLAALEEETNLGKWEHVELDKEAFLKHLRNFMMLTDRPFIMDKDEAFVRNLRRNYELCETAWRMKKWVSDAIAGGYFPKNYDLAEVETKIAKYAELKEYLDTQKELMKNPYYQYMAKKDVSYTDKQIDDLITKTGNEELKEYLTTVKKLRGLSFVRSKDMDSVQTKAEKEGKRQAVILQTRERKRQVLRIFSDEALEIRGTQRFRDKDSDAKFDALNFRNALENFRNLSLKDLHFKSLRDIADHYKENARIFAESREFEHLLFVAMQKNLVPAEAEMMKFRAKISAFKNAEYMMCEMQRNMLNDPENFLNGKTEQEFTEACRKRLKPHLMQDTAYDMPLPGMDMDSYYKQVYKAIQKEHSDRKKTIKLAYGYTHPVKQEDEDSGEESWKLGKISAEKLTELSNEYERNSFINGYIADLELYTQFGYGALAESFALSYGRKKGKELTMHRNRVLSRYILGMSGEELKAFFDTQELGTDRQREELWKKIYREAKDQNFTELDSNDPKIFMSQLAYKSRLSGLYANLSGDQSLMEQYVRDKEIVKDAGSLYDVGCGHAQKVAALSQTMRFKWMRSLPLANWFSLNPELLEDFQNALSELADQDEKGKTRIVIDDKVITKNGTESRSLENALGRPYLLKDGTMSRHNAARKKGGYFNTPEISMYEARKKQGLIRDTTSKELARITDFYRKNHAGWTEPAGLLKNRTQLQEKVDVIEKSIGKILSFDLKRFNYRSYIDIVDSAAKDPERFAACREILWLAREVLDNSRAYFRSKEMGAACHISEAEFDEIKARYLVMRQAMPLFDHRFIGILESPVLEKSGLSLEEVMHLSEEEMKAKRDAANKAKDVETAKFWGTVSDICDMRHGFDLGMDLSVFLHARRLEFGIQDDSVEKAILNRLDQKISVFDGTAAGDIAVMTQDDEEFKNRFADAVTRRKLTVPERESKMNDAASTLGKKRVNARTLLTGREAVIKERIAARRKISAETRMQAGEENIIALSAFMSADEKANEQMLKDYAGEKSRFELLDRFAKKIISTSFDLTISEDHQFAEQAGRLEEISSQAIAFQELLAKNPDYLESLRVKGLRDEKSDADNLTERLNSILALSDYYRARTVLMTDPYYVSRYDDELSAEQNERSTEDERYLSDLIRLTAECARRIHKGSAVNRQDSDMDGVLRALEQKNRQRAYLFGQPDLKKADIAYTKRAEQEIKLYFDKVTEGGKVDPATISQTIGTSNEEHPFPDAAEYETEAVKMHLAMIKKHYRFTSQEYDEEFLVGREKEIHDAVSPTLMGMDSFTFHNPANKETLNLGTNPHRIINELTHTYGTDIPSEEIAEIIDGFDVIKQGKLDEKDPKVIAYARQRWLESMKKLFYLEYNSIKRFESTYGTLPDQLPPGTFMHTLGDYQFAFYTRGCFTQNMAELTDGKTCSVGGESMTMGQYLVKEGLIREEELADAIRLNREFYQNTVFMYGNYMSMAATIYDDDEDHECAATVPDLVEHLNTRRQNDLKGPKLNFDEERKYWQDAVSEGGKSLFANRKLRDFRKDHLNIYTEEDLETTRELRKQESRLILLYKETVNERAAVLSDRIREEIGWQVGKDLIDRLIVFHPAMRNEVAPDKISKKENDTFISLVRDYAGIGVSEKDKKEKRKAAYLVMSAYMKSLITPGFGAEHPDDLIDNNAYNDRSSRIHYESDLMKTVLLEQISDSVQQLMAAEPDKSVIDEKAYRSFRDNQKNALKNIVFLHLKTDKRYLALKDLGNRERTVPDIEMAETERLLAGFGQSDQELDTGLEEQHRSLLKKLYGIEIMSHAQLMEIAGEEGPKEKSAEAPKERSKEEPEEEEAREKRSVEKEPEEERIDYPENGENEINEEDEVNEDGEFVIDTTSEEKKEEMRRKKREQKKEQANKNRINVMSVEEEVLAGLQLPALPQHKRDLGMTTGDYEQQSVRNCWCVAGAALLNKFMGKKVANQKNMREFSPKDDELKSFAECKALAGENFDEKDYVRNILHQRVFMGAGKTEFGSIYEAADFFIRHDRNMAVRSLTFNIPSLKNRVNATLVVDKPRDEIEKDLILYHEQKKAFLDEVSKILATGQPVAIVDNVNKHFRTITAIDGEKLIVLDSAGLKQEPKEVEALLPRAEDGNTVEINWLSRLRPPVEELAEQPLLKYSDQEGYSLERDAGNDVDNYVNPMWVEGISVATTDKKLGITRRSYLPLKKKRPKTRQPQKVRELLENPQLLDQVQPVQDQKVKGEKQKKQTEVTGEKQKKQTEATSEIHISEEPHKTGEKTQSKKTQLLDEKAEKLVSSCVSDFAKYCATLNDKKFGSQKDELWADMKQKAAALTADWEKKSDLQRGDALADVLITANKLMTKNGKKASKSRLSAVNEFRAFFKRTLESMSMNCRVLALERIFSKVDAMEDDPKVSDAMKKANDSVFAELARAWYVRNNPGAEKYPEAVETIDDMHYRFLYEDEKSILHKENLLREFGGTSDYRLASLVYNFDRHSSLNMLADDFRLDRFGNVLPEDTEKWEQWKKLFRDFADAVNDEKKGKQKLLDIHRRFYARAAGWRVNPEWCTMKGVKKHLYDVKAFANIYLCLENLTSCFQHPEKEMGVLMEIREWNASHPGDQIPEETAKKIFKVCDNEKVLKKNRALYEKIPSISNKSELHYELAASYVNGIECAKGIKVSSPINFQMPQILQELDSVAKFFRNPKKKCRCINVGYTLVHKNGDAFIDGEDTDKNDNLRYDAKNPLMFAYERSQLEVSKLLERLQKTGYLNGSDRHGDALERVNKRITLFAGAEETAMKKFHELTKSSGDQEGRAAIDKLYKDYITELEEQAAAAEIVFQADMESMEGNHSIYYQEVLKYFEGRKKINALFDQLESAREEFLKANAGQKEFDLWKKELDDSRMKAREELARIENAGTTVADRLKRAFYFRAAARSVEAFSDEEYEQVKKNNEIHDTWHEEQRQRVLEAFIIPANRDFSGAYLTKQDRYQADFNRRFKQGMMSGNAETIKALSKEFTERVLPLITSYEFSGVEEITPEDIEEKYVKTGQIKYARVKLTMLSNVNNQKNTDFPLLKTGLEDLEKEDPERYKQLSETLSLRDPTMIEMYMPVLGLDTQNLIPVEERNREKLRPAFQVTAMQYLQDLEHIKKR